MDEANEEFSESVARAKTVQDILEAGKAFGVEVTEAEARGYFAVRDGGALSDEALDEVAGGGLHKGGHLIVTSWYQCELFERIPHSRTRSIRCEFCKHCNTAWPFDTCRIR